MQKIYTILFSSLLLLAASCTKEQEEIVIPKPAKDKVPIIMSFADDIALQASTKAEDGMEMGLSPIIKTIHVAVFGGSGYLKDYVSAIPCNSSGTPVDGFVSENDTPGYFKVYLPFDEGPSRRRIHIIANGPSSLPFNAYEDEIMKNLTVRDGNGAYWTRFETANGIQIKTTDSGSGPIRDQDANGDYIPTDATKALFQNLTLIRNFAAITVEKHEEAGNNFAIDGFTVCNMPKEGAVAIYHEPASCWIPGVDYAELSLDQTAHLTYSGEAYPGFPLSPIIDTYIPKSAAAFNAAGVSASTGQYKYVYERAVTNDNAPFVLLKARFVNEGSTVAADSPTFFYRLDITPDDNFVPFYRNFKYHVKIQGIKLAGYGTPEEASKRNSGDNFSVSIETQSLSDVSNGTTRLYIQQPEIASLYTAGENSFWFQFHVNEGGVYGSGYYNARGSQSTSHGTAVITLEEITTGALKSGWSSSVSGDKGIITYQLNEPAENENLTSVIRITGDYTPTGGGRIRLVREVTITVFSKKSITASFSPDIVGPFVGEKTRLNIDLPSDLTKGMFPLTILIEDSSLSLNPNEDNVPVMPGPSIIRDNDNSYQFRRTVNWSEYQELLEEAALSGDENPVVSVEMKTTKAVNTTAYISSEVFNTSTATLTIDNQTYITPSHVEVDHNSHSDLSFKVISSGNWTLSITNENGTAAVGATLSVDSGTATDSSGQAVTVSIPENPGTGERTFVLSLRNVSSGVTRQANIIQTGKTFTFTAANTSVPGNTTSVTLSITSNYTGSWTVAALTDGDSVSPASGTGNASVTLTMPINYSFTEDITHTVTATAPGGFVRTITIVQRHARTNPGQFVTFEIGREDSDDFNPDQHGPIEKGGVEAGFDDVSEWPANGWFGLGSIFGRRDYITLTTGSTLSLSITDDKIVYQINQVAMTFNNSYAPNANGYNTTVDGIRCGSVSDTSQTVHTWTGDFVDTDHPLVIEFTKGNNEIRMTQIKVTYTGYAWD